MANGALLWCLRCARYTERTLKGLREVCQGRPLNATRAKKLRQGRHPITGRWLGQPQRASGETWWSAVVKPRDRSNREGLSIVLGPLEEDLAEQVCVNSMADCLDRKGLDPGAAGAEADARPR